MRTEVHNRPPDILYCDYCVVAGGYGGGRGATGTDLSDGGCGGTLVSTWMNLSDGRRVVREGFLDNLPGGCGGGRFFGCVEETWLPAADASCAHADVGVTDEAIRHADNAKVAALLRPM
jgi:hypothetical protein